MSWETWREDNRKGWDSRVPVHIGPDGYDRQRLIDDPNALSRVVEFDRKRFNAGEPLHGLDVVHLQCHLGTDTLSLLRCGAASVTGLDFSAVALRECQWLFAQAQVAGRFVESDVYDALNALDSTYDVVYASVGAINWIPDIAAWMRVAAALLRPGGELYVRDVHPMYMAISPDSPAGVLQIGYDYFETAEPGTSYDAQTYSGDGTPIAYPVSHEWNHGIAEILQGVMDSGLSLLSFWEDDHADWKPFAHMVEGDDGLFRLPPGTPRIPFSFALRARKSVS